MKKIVKRILLVLLVLTVAYLVYFGIFLINYHAADETALQTIQSPSEGVTTVVTDDTITFVPAEPVKAGLVFYPGMKIRGEAYALFADTLAANGYLCVLVNMPLNMAALNGDAALSILESWPAIEDWYIGGHSLGGQAAQKCALDNPGIFRGVITVARQLDYDFSASDLPILAVFAGEDAVCTPEDIAEDEANTNPSCYTEVIIPGGCHSYFGNYGYQQRWDGTPTITPEEQRHITVAAILDFLEATPSAE